MSHRIIAAFLTAPLIASLAAALLTVDPYQPDLVTILGLIPIFYFFLHYQCFFWESHCMFSWQRAVG
jgi:hypothetical protein